MDPIKRQARRAGLLYLLVALTAPVSLVYVPGQLYVAGDATATAAHLRAAEGLLRTGVFCELFHQAVEVFLVLALYRLLRPVDRPLARQMAVLGLVPIPMMFLNAVSELAALALAKGTGYLDVFSPAQLDALAMLFVRLHGLGVQSAAVFWGLWLFPFGLLVMRSGFLPRWSGALLLGAGAGYVLGSLTTLVLPALATPLGGLATLLQLGELPIIVWLAAVGARAPAAAPTAPAAEPPHEERALTLDAAVDLV
ncbi:MAG: DUF4386 domain-containing protein, partial [Proteobacteria bacterium]|nr:DUF4386 domain-containing protein [Pseudomonadota bacterium]